MGDTTYYSATICGPLTDRHVRLISSHLESTFAEHNGVHTDTSSDGHRTHAFSWYDHSCGDTQELANTLLALFDADDPDGGAEVDCTTCDGTGENADSTSCNACDGDGVRTELLPPFAIWAFEDPTREWLGDVRIHIPNGPTFAGECSEGGAPVVLPGPVLTLANNATDLDQLKRDLADLTGDTAIAAFRAFPSTPPAP